MFKKSTARNCVVTSSLLFGAMSVGLLLETAAAGPQDPVPVAGTVNFNFIGNTFIIEASDGAIITYSAFDLTPGQLAQFIQPHSGARVLNHITGGMPSSIDGDLLANGIVYFANPAGIIFGNNAVVNVGGIYAAAANIDYGDFTAGTDQFHNILGNVHIQPNAVISASSAAHFIGRQILNEGTVSVPNGAITMAGHDGTVTIVEAGGHYILNLSGGTDIGAGNFGVDNAGVVDAGTGQVVLGAGDLYSSAIRLSGNGISGGDVRFDSNVELASDVHIAGDEVTFEGTIDGGFALSVGGNVIFNGDVGQLDALASLLVQGTTESSAGNISTTGTQTFEGAVTLLAHALLTGSQITFEQSVDGGVSLTIAGDVVFSGQVGDVTPLTSLLVQGIANIGGDISTTGAQTYEDAVNLLSDAVLSGSLVRFESTVDGAHALTIDGDVHLLGDVNVASVLAQGTAQIGADVTTTGSQEYVGATTLIQNALLTGSTVTFRNTVEGGFELEIDGNAVFEESVDIGQLLVQGLTTIDNAKITTAGSQEYVGAVSLLQDALLSGSTVTFGSTVDGLFYLEIDADAVFEDSVELAQLLVHGATTIDNAKITTTGTQEYLGAVTLMQDALLAGSLVTFRSTVDGAFAMEIDGEAVFEGDVNIAQLLVHGASTIDTANMTTTGTQEYVGAVTVLQNALMTGSTVTFRNTLEGAVQIEIDGNAVFEESVELAQLLVQGMTTIDNAKITTTGTQEYVGAVTLLQNSLLTGSTVTFRNTLEGGFAVEIDGNAVFEESVDIGQLLVHGLTTIDNAKITTAGSQEYIGAVSLLQDALLSGSTVTFGSTVDGLFYMEIDADANFGGNVNLNQLLVHGASTIDAANMTTVGTQEYIGAVTLLQDALMAGSLVTFRSTVDGAFAMEIDGDVVFEGNVDLFSLNANNDALVSAELIRTTEHQSYKGLLTFQGGTNYTLDAGTSIATADVVTSDGDLAMIGQTVTLDTDVAVTGGSLDVTGLFVGGGNVSAENDISVHTDGAFVAGDVHAATGNVLFADAAVFGGSIKAGQDVTLQGSSEFINAAGQSVTAENGTLHAHGIINSSNAGDLTLTAGQQVLADQDVLVSGGGLVASAPQVRFGGNVTTSGSQKVTANVIQTNGTHATTDSDVTFDGDVQLQNATSVQAGAGNISFGGNITGPHALAATSSGITTFSGPVDIAQLVSNGGGVTVLQGGQITTSGNQTYGNDVVIDQVNATLAAGGSVLFMQTVNSAAGEGRGLSVSGTNGVTFSKSVGAGAGGRLGHLSADSAGGPIIFGTDGGDAVEVLTQGDIRLNTDSPGNNSSFATIGGWGDLRFNTANGDFVMGQNQKLTALGTLRIEAANGAAYIGDLSALNDIHVTGEEIWIILRPAVDEFDQGVDFVTGGQFFFNVSPVFGVFDDNGNWHAGGGLGLPMPQFAGPDTDLDGSGTLQGYLLRVFSDGLTRDADMLDGLRFRDVAAKGSATTDVTTALAAELVDESETEEVSDEAQLSATDRERLEQSVNLVVRDLTPAELMDFALGRGLYLDQESRDRVVGLTPAERYAVSIGRLDSRSSTIDGVIAAFEQIVRSRDDLQLSDSQISEALDVAWDGYRASSEVADPRAFPQYLRQRVAADETAVDEVIALDVIDHLRSFERAFQAVGPNSHEVYRLAIEAQLSKFQGREITEQQLKDAVYAAE